MRMTHREFVDAFTDNEFKRDYEVVLKTIRDYAKIGITHSQISDITGIELDEVKRIRDSLQRAGLVTHAPRTIKHRDGNISRVWIPKEDHDNSSL